MKALLDRFASLRVTVTLLVLLLFALAAGTIVESLHGAEAALRSVYGASWFYALLAVFALNLACSLVSLWPWGSRRIGYATTHLSMLVILGGALTTELGKVEGQLQVWEGEESSTVIGRSARPQAEPAVVATLPFAVRLDAFEIDYYQGTRRPAQFRSRVTVRDAAAGREVPAVIEMNHELAYGGYRFFQSSYQETPGRDQTILSVSNDPGEPIVFVGYYTLVAGMIVVLATRIRERRRALRPAGGAALARPPRPLARGDARLGAARSSPAVPGDVEALRRLPVQHDGRVMPLDTLAREAVWNVTGKTERAGASTRWRWSSRGPSTPAPGSSQPIVPVKDDRLAAEIGLPARDRAGPRSRPWPGNERPSAADAAPRRLAGQQERPLAPLEKAAQKLEGRLLWMQQLLDHSALRVGAGRAIRGAVDGARAPALRRRPARRSSTPAPPPGASRPSGPRSRSSTTGSARRASRGGSCALAAALDRGLALDRRVLDVAGRAPCSSPASR